MRIKESVDKGKIRWRNSFVKGKRAETFLFFISFMLLFPINYGHLCSLKINQFLGDVAALYAKVLTHPLSQTFVFSQSQILSTSLDKQAPLTPKVSYMLYFWKYFL